MGGSHSTVSVTEDYLPVHPPLETHSILKEWHLVDNNGGGGGICGHRLQQHIINQRRQQVLRMYKSYRIKHNNSGGVVGVLKVAYLQKYTATQEKELELLSKELSYLKDRTASLCHIWPVTAWWGCNSFKGVVSVHPVVWVRPYAYTTLHDRLVHNHRPLCLTEQWFWIYQLITAVQSLHDVDIVHGALSTHNVACTSTGWLILMDLMPSQGFRPVSLPNDDPTEYLYAFSQTTCCLAPERFDPNTDKLTKQMDVFSLGCTCVELALNGEPCWDLGPLLEYRKLDPSSSEITPWLHQKLQKIESSALRAACRHMLHRDPSQRLQPIEYWQRFKQQTTFLGDNHSGTGGGIVQIYQTLYQLLHKITTKLDTTPDARLYHAYTAYPDILFQTMGVRLAQPSSPQQPQRDSSCSDKENTQPVGNASIQDLWAETEALLKDLDATVPLPDIPDDASASFPPNDSNNNSNDTHREPRTPLEQSSLLIYVQFILNTVRHVQRPATKLCALRLLCHVVDYVTDEVRLQRMVPVLVALLKDSDAVVRGTTVTVLIHTLQQLTSFPPSDAALLPRYIWKRVTPLLTADPCVSVRIAVARHVGQLAETALRFLDISHAVRMVQAVEAGGTQTPSTTTTATTTNVEAAAAGESIFEERVTQLLDQAAVAATATNESKPPPSTTTNTTTGPTLLVRSTYQEEHSQLAETLSRWVVHICTDQSEHASLVKRALLENAVPGLCHFFGLEGVLGFLVPQLLAFLNDWHDWQLRASLLREGLPVLCQVIGRSATEEFVLPCIEIGLLDAQQEHVIQAALQCLTKLMEQGLLSRAIVVQPSNARSSTNNTSRLLERYSAFLIHPSKGIRRSAIQAFCATARALGSPDAMVYLIPIVLPFVRFQPTWKHLSKEPDMIQCLKRPWTRNFYQEQWNQATLKNNTPWTTVVGGVHITEMAGYNRNNNNNTSGDGMDDNGTEASLEDNKRDDPMVERMQSYLRMLAKHAMKGESFGTRRTLEAIEGSLKLAQSVVFPRRSAHTLPDWYRDLRDKAETEDSYITEASAIRSVSTLGSVYGLSIMGPGATDENMIGAAEIRDDLNHETIFLDSEDSKTMELAFMGDWDSEVRLDPDVVDTTLLVTKLRALQVPTLAPPLGAIVSPATSSTGSSNQTKSNIRPPPAKEPAPEWKPRMNSMIASSSTISGHTAPVVRLAVSLDSTFFVSASHDGTCGVWEVPQLEHSSGFLEKSTTYSGHNQHGGGPTRVNDVAMVEGTYSVVSGASNGTVHVWRVDMVSSSSSTATALTKVASPLPERRERSRVVGTTSVRETDPSEGEILAVSQFTSVSNSVVVYATQKGVVRTWDLRSAEEPFSLAHGPKLGHLSAMALGGDRNWIITGSSRGFLCLWDVRFQQPFKLWRHSSGEKIHRLAASFVPHPQTWGTPNAIGMARPFVFVGSPNNECSMFDILSGSCVECFRTMAADTNAIHASKEIPALVDVSGRLRMRNGVLHVIDEGFQIPRKNFLPSVNCMVGSIGGHGNSFLLTGGSDGYIRSWDFSIPSRSYIISGAPAVQPRPRFERVDFDGSRRLMLCRQQHSSPPTREFASGTQGLKKPEFFHTDAIEDLKVVDNSALVSCSRDCTIKVWR